MSNVSVSRASSASRARSAFERPSREISNPKTAPTSPRHSRVIRWRYPSRPRVEAPETPRSVSITSISVVDQPSATAVSRNAYCRSVDSVCSRTCISVDWRR